MIGMDCEATRDLLPLLHRGETSAAEAAAVGAHLRACAGCAQELRIVAAVAAAVEPVPAELEPRVLSVIRPLAARRRAPARLALAATVAAALVGGSLAVQRWGFNFEAPAQRGIVALDDNGSAPALSWAVYEDALLHSGTPLQQLSVEELELLLAELES